MTTRDGSGSVTVLFDIDGTLVDSNYLHVDAWDRAFAAVGHPVDVWRIHRSVGMDSGKLIEHVLGGKAAAVEDAVKEHHSAFYLDTADRLRAIGGAKELIEELVRRGHEVVLATSAPESELELLLPLLDVDDLVTAVTSSEDVGTAKPDPDIIGVAMDKASAKADQTVMVGDAVWDVEAANRAGVRSIGLLSGGFGREELLTAGAAAVYEDVAELLEQLDQSPIARES